MTYVKSVVFAGFVAVIAVCVSAQIAAGRDEECADASKSGLASPMIYIYIDGSGELSVRCIVFTRYDLPGWKAGFEVRNSSVVTIPEMAFANLDNVTKLLVHVNSSISSIGDRAFNNCSALFNVTYYGASVPVCGSDVFGGCPLLEYVCVLPTYTNNTFCGLPVNRSCLPSTVDPSLTVTVDVNPTDPAGIDSNDVVRCIATIAGVDPDNFTIGYELNSEGLVILINVYCLDENTVKSVVSGVNDGKMKESDNSLVRNMVHARVTAEDQSITESDAPVRMSSSLLTLSLLVVFLSMMNA